MADEGNAGTFEYTLSGRAMTFLKTQPGQLGMMRRYVDVLQNVMAKATAANDAAAADAAVNKIHEVAWTAVESRFTSEADLDFVRMEVICGRITEPELFAILSNGASSAAPDDDADPVPAKKAVRKAAKKTANPRRAAR
jgi:hypothetical protein